MAQCLQLNYFSVSEDSVKWDNGKDTELIITTTDLLDDLGQKTHLFWAPGSWFTLRRLNSSVDFKVCHGLPMFLYLNNSS